MAITEPILTVGHSDHSYEEFFQLLRGAGVTAVADVRSYPFSRRNPQFDCDSLKRDLQADGIEYVQLGNELGGRPTEKHFFCDGIADYERMAKAPGFLKGLERVIKGAERYRIALMCSEKDPLDCHRCLLVGRALHERGFNVGHILFNGEQKSQSGLEEELLALRRQENRADLFPQDQLAAAYRDRSKKVAYEARTEDVGQPSASAAE
jgi:uncharacterized protein (DUF488 family)